MAAFKARSCWSGLFVFEMVVCSPVSYKRSGSLHFVLRSSIFPLFVCLLKGVEGAFSRCLWLGRSNGVAQFCLLSDSAPDRTLTVSPIPQIHAGLVIPFLCYME